MMNRLAIGLIILVSVFFVTAESCSKSSASGSQAYLSLTHVAPGMGPFDVFLAGTSLTPGTQLVYGNTTATAGAPYLTGPAGTHDFRVTPDGQKTWLDGNIFLQNGLHYSVFIYDTLQSGSLKALELEDGTALPADTLSFVRFLDFVPDTAQLGVVLLNATDTFSFGLQTYIGLNPNVSTLSQFKTIKAGSYLLLMGVDSTLLLQDSLQFTGGSRSSIIARGFLQGTGNQALAIDQLPLFP